MDSNRDEVLLNRLKLKGRLELGEAMTLLQISESTARRLFSRLEEEGELLATLAVPGGDSPQTVQADIEKGADRHNVYLVIPEKGRKLVFE